MSTKMIRESDLSGDAGAEPVRLAIGDGRDLEVDLTLIERGELEDLLRPYLSVARLAGGKRRVVPETTPGERERIRAWAREQGDEVAPYGRIPRRVRDAYDEAHGIKRVA